MLCHNASFPPDSSVLILTTKEAFVNLIARVVKLIVRFVRHLLLHLTQGAAHDTVRFFGQHLCYHSIKKGLKRESDRISSAYKRFALFSLLFDELYDIIIIHFC